MKKILLLLFITTSSVAQKISIEDDIKLRVGFMEIIVERKKSNENTFRDAQYKVLSFINFTDGQKKVLDTLFSNSWNKRLNLFNKIDDVDDVKNINEFIRHLVSNERVFRNQLTKEQLEIYNSELKKNESKSDDGRKVILRSMYFTDEQYKDYLAKFK